MTGALFSQPTYLAARSLVDATVVRHEALASNLANLETPRYRRLDLAPSFGAALSRAVAAQDPAQIRSVRPTLTVDSTAVASNRDGNTVQLENELFQMSQNTLTHTVATQVVSGALRKLRLAITGRPV